MNSLRLRSNLVCHIFVVESITCREGLWLKDALEIFSNAVKRSSIWVRLTDRYAVINSRLL